MKLMVDMSTEISSEVEINESTSDKTYVIKGTFSSPGKKNRNGRVYSTPIWEDNVKRYQEEIKNNTINTLAELEHPPRSTVDQWQAVAKTRLLEMRDGLVYGEMEILNNNSEKTNQIKALIDSGIQIGVSTRGVGRMKGSIVEEYNLITTDIVSNPSDYGASLEGFNESMILEDSNFSIEEGKVICTESGCAVPDEVDAPDIISYNETKCQSGAKKLLEAFVAYSTPEVIISENQKDAMALIKKTALDAITEADKSRLADKLLAGMKDTKEQMEFERANGSVYKMELPELKKHLKVLGINEDEDEITESQKINEEAKIKDLYNTLTQADDSFGVVLKTKVDKNDWKKFEEHSDTYFQFIEKLIEGK